MRAVIQRVAKASVEVEDRTISSIDKGLLVLLGIGVNDSPGNHEKFADKIVNLRIFEDGSNKMNLSLLDVAGELLLVSQFTLFSDVKRGRRPSFTMAAQPEKALEIFNEFSNYLETFNIKVRKGEFGANMKVSLCNCGPVTIVIDEDRDL